MCFVGKHTFVQTREKGGDPIPAGFPTTPGHTQGTSSHSSPGGRALSPHEHSRAARHQRPAGTGLGQEGRRRGAKEAEIRGTHETAPPKWPI